VNRLNSIGSTLLNQLPVAKATTAFKRLRHILLHLLHFLYLVYLIVAEEY
jgi:hypothetical protein